MPEIQLRVGGAIRCLNTVGKLLILLTPVPAKEDGGIAARAGMKMRGMRRVLSQAQEDAFEQTSRGGDEATTLATMITLSFNELLTREDWDAIALTKEHMFDGVDERGNPVSRLVTLHKTEADLDALGPLFDETGEVPA